MTPFQQVIQAVGSQRTLSGLLGVSEQAVSNWSKAGFPEDRCPAIEAASGIRCEVLRPDIDWTRGADGKVTGYHVAVTGHPSSRPEPAANEGDAAPTDGTPLPLKQAA